MKHFIITIALLTCLLNGNAQRTSTFPAPKGFVNDFENDFTPDQLKELDYNVKELLAKALDDDTLKGLEIAVVTVTDKMYGDAKEMGDYLTMLGDKWNLGAQSGGRGIIIGYSKSLRKVSIIAGTGLDNILPPKECHRIIDEKMAPQFRKGNYYDAILTAVKSIKEYLKL